MAKAKPFVKWVGGKSQLIGQLETLLPAYFDSMEDVTYIEPFVGGGAMLFHMLQTHKNIKHAVINDINPDLTTCYTTVRDHPDALIRIGGKVIVMGDHDEGLMLLLHKALKEPEHIHTGL